MNKEIHAIQHDVDLLATHARALFVATADSANDKIVAARDQLEAVLDSGRHITDVWRERANDGARYCRDIVKEHPYQALAIGLTVGAFIGLCSVRHLVRENHGRR
jgi:ElaB/YqjD/DUF883 family membrane-anchored ribosome-binding protein